jgi:hypothetical protein
LAGEGVGISQAIHAREGDPGVTAGGSAMLTGLRALQADPATTVIALLSKTTWPAAAEQILVQIRDSDKPAVVCFPGANQRLIWRAGAIPAVRLDETALRAAAWVRGWDQALVSSRLEDEDEQLAVQADDLRAKLGPARHWLQGVFTSEIMCREAELMLLAVAGESAPNINLTLTTDRALGTRNSCLRAALDNPKMAVILLDLVLGRNADPDPVAALAGVPREDRDGPAIIAHLCGTLDLFPPLAEQEAMLSEQGVILASSNAAAARLAGMLMRGLDRGL